MSCSGGQEIPDRVYTDLQLRARLPAGGKAGHHRQAGPAGAGDLPGQSGVKVIVQFSRSSSRLIKHYNFPPPFDELLKSLQLIFHIFTK